MLDVEVFGTGLAPGAPPIEVVRRLCVRASASAGVHDGHLAIEFVDAAQITRLNAEHRDQDRPTDVLSFPIDGAGTQTSQRRGRGGGAEHGERPAAPPRELGDVVICPEHTSDLREAIVHGVLHLLGMDHETDDGQMLSLQRELLAREKG